METISLSDNTTNLQSVPEISPTGLAQILESGDRVQIVDVRLRTGIAAGLIPESIVLHIPGSRLLRYAHLGDMGIDPAIPVVVICGHGNDSRTAAHHLNRLGARAQSLAGGMAAWMMFSIPRVLAPPPGLDRLVQFDRVGKEALSYVLISSGEALIIDPPRDPRALLRSIEESGATLAAVADTHVHADYISGAVRIARDRGIPYYLHPADSVFPYDGTPGQVKFMPVSDGLQIRIGRCPITVLHTPGHSPGSVTYLVGDDAAFTGDFLFITSVGRPDLADRTKEWSTHLWKSVQMVKGAWQSDLMIYPAHYTAGTPRTNAGAIAESFGQLLRRNPSLRMTDVDEFFSWIMANVRSAPEAYRTIKGINVGLFTVDELEADILENGKNECAIGGV
ncbi:MAG: MBL fold metallo-hydrolase [Bacteroidota bacterium]